MSDLFGDHVVCFPTRRLIYKIDCSEVSTKYISSCVAFSEHMKTLTYLIINSVGYEILNL